MRRREISMVWRQRYDLYSILVDPADERSIYRSQTVASLTDFYDGRSSDWYSRIVKHFDGCRAVLDLGAGPGLTLEENWIMPVDGSIASLVRMTGNGSTSMIELIVIEEENDSLVLRIKQWDPGFKPRSPEPQVMELVSVGENSVSFRAVSEGGMKTLGYSRPASDAFNIDVETDKGAKFQIKLKAR